MWGAGLGGRRGRGQKGVWPHWWAGPRVGVVASGRGHVMSVHYEWGWRGAMGQEISEEWRGEERGRGHDGGVVGVGVVVGWAWSRYGHDRDVGVATAEAEQELKSGCTL